MKNIYSLLSLFICLTTLSWAQQSEFYGNFTPTTSHLEPISEKISNGKKVIVKPNFKGKEAHEADQSQTHNPDWVWQQHEDLEKTTSASVLWQVQGLGSNMSPPDPSLDSDSTVVIAATNSGGGAVFRIFNKLTGATIASSLTMVSLGGPTGYGDPIVLYYKPAKRWFLTEFSSTGNKLVVHVSQTSNPQGAYFTYQFTCPSFPDYPKWSFSPTSDALVVSTNEGGPPRIYAMKLSNLLTGAASPFIGIPIGYTLNGFGFQSITPVDIEGDTPAPTAMKPLFIRHRDDESHSNGSPDSPTNDWLELWEMTINWTASTATVAKIQDISIAEIDSKLCGLTSFTCVPQPGTTVKLDPLRETVMFKAPMRVFSTHQAMVVCLSTDVNGSDRAGIRWCELRRPTGSISANWTLHQEGTYAPGTTTSRWMPAINIDKNGSIIMAYSTSSNTAGDFPSLKMTGRKACDPLGQMTMAETNIVGGASSKTSDTRWGDYHHMSIDRWDGVTFYYTGVYRDASATRSNVSALRMNPDAIDATIVNVFQVIPGAICGSSIQMGIIIKNNGTTAITSGSFTWQVGSGTVSTVNYISNQLNTNGSTDTIFVTVSGLGVGSNILNFMSSTVNGAVDENTCNDAFTNTLSIGNNLLNVSYVINAAPSCTGTNGQITFTVGGGTAPYNYTINGSAGQNSNVFSGLAAGTINYAINDISGCTANGSFALNPTTSITVTSTNSNVSCAGLNNASVQITPSGGQSAYTYSMNGVTYQSSNTFVGLSAGTYTVYAKDANGCVGSSTVTLTAPTAVLVNAIPTAITCFGNSNGAINISATGGTPSYTYSTNGSTFVSNSTFSNLAAGNYTVTAQDANGCTATFNTTIVEPPALVASGIATGSTGNDGTITLTGNGGNAPYTYSINGINYYSGTLFTSLTPGVYTCYVKDVNGCIDIIEITVETVQGIQDLNGVNISLLYPNPNQGIFELEIKGIVGDDVECKLFTEDGRMVSWFKLSVSNGESKNTIEMSHKLAAGKYFLGVYDGSRAGIISFVRQ